MADLTVTTANIRFGAGARVDDGIADEVLALGDIVYRKRNGRWAKAQADVADLEKLGTDRIGMAAGAATAAGQPVLVCLEDANMTHGIGSFASGDVSFISDATAGAQADKAGFASGDAVVLLVVSLTATAGAFRPTIIGEIS